MNHSFPFTTSAAVDGLSRLGAASRRCPREIICMMYILVSNLSDVLIHILYFRLS